MKSTKPWLVKQNKISWNSTISILNVNMRHNNLNQMTKLDQHVKIILCQQVFTYKVYYNYLVPQLPRCITVINCVYTEVTLYSNTCGGQNIAAMFMYAVHHSTTLKCITHNFLESGYSHMECDSIHTAIEHKKKYVDIFTMLD